MDVAVPKLHILVLPDFHRHQMHIPVPHTGLRNDPVRTGTHKVNPPFQDHGFQAVIVVKVDVLRGDRKVMMVMLDLRHPGG